MSGKTYLITGANRGIGMELVRQASGAGANDTVFACVRSLKGEIDDLKKLASDNPNIHMVECDTSSIGSIEACRSKISGLLEHKSLDYLINNAAIHDPSTKARTALDFTGEELKRHIDINVMGPAEMVKAFDGLLSKGSVVLNMSSGCGSCAKGINVVPVYSISKSALNMLTLHQSYALKERGASVIVMDPGWVQTRMGGYDATLTPQQSVEGILNVLRNVTLEKSGTFYQYDGEIVPW